MGTMIRACTLTLLWGSATLLAMALENQGHCGPPRRLQFAELEDKYKDTNVFPVGSTVKYVCRPGYARFKFKRLSTCLGSQKWSEIEEFCKKKSCGHPGEPDNGRLQVSGDFLLGATIHYICEEGHRLIGQSSRTCLIFDKTVTWTGSIPFCERIPCFPPPNIAHGKHSATYMDDFSYGTVVTYTCDEGYPLVGDASIHCTTEDGLNGVWSSHPYCGEAHCPSPQVENGRIIAGKSSTYTYRQRVTIDCSLGHRISGSREIHCQVDGTWDPPIPTCEQVVQCRPPPDIQNGIHSNQKVEDLTHEISVTYRCHPGYVLIGEATIYCTASGTWSSPAPRCKAVERTVTTVLENEHSKKMEKETLKERETSLEPGSPGKTVWSLEKRVQRLERCVLHAYQTCLQKTKDEEEEEIVK